jgi:prevent-host-death family protein
MKAVPYGVRELQAKIGEALRIVERGGSIVVTSRGRPVAMVVPPGAGWRRVARGLGAAADGGGGPDYPGQWQAHPPVRGFPIKGLSDQVIKDRQDRQDVIEGRS